MRFQTRRFELEICARSFVFLRMPFLGQVYIGRDAGAGCFIWDRPTAT